MSIELCREKGDDDLCISYSVSITIRPPPACPCINAQKLLEMSSARDEKFHNPQLWPRMIYCLFHAQNSWKYYKKELESCPYSALKLRENNLGLLKHQNLSFLPILRALNFVDLVNFRHQKMKKCFEIKTQNSSKCLKTADFSNSRISKTDFT